MAGLGKIYNDFKQWVDANREWLPANAINVELDPVTGSPLSGQRPPAEDWDTEVDFAAPPPGEDEFM